jgi:hypothetical protein
MDREATRMGEPGSGPRPSTRSSSSSRSSTRSGSTSQFEAKAILLGCPFQQIQAIPLIAGTALLADSQRLTVIVRRRLDQFQGSDLLVVDLGLDQKEELGPGVQRIAAVLAVGIVSPWLIRIQGSSRSLPQICQSDCWMSMAVSSGASGAHDRAEQRNLRWSHGSGRHLGLPDCPADLGA